MARQVALWQKAAHPSAGAPLANGGWDLASGAPQNAVRYAPGLATGRPPLPQHGSHQPVRQVAGTLLYRRIRDLRPQQMMG
jgi:hypothetical protein